MSVPGFVLRCFVVAAVLISSAACVAQPPDRLFPYRILPRFSVLHQTGGFAGVNKRYRLRGEYDLHVGWDFDFPNLDLFARFVDPEIWGTNMSPLPTPAIALDVDEIFNLVELEGEPIPVGAPFDVYRFHGRTELGERVNLLGVQMGPWMYVRGSTTPPPNSADFFEYDIRWVARTRPWADINEDGIVDAADYVAYRDSYGDAQDIDLTAWRSQFGEQPDMAMLEGMMDTATGALSLSVGSVPEPSTIALLTTGAVVALWQRRRNLR